MVSRSGLDCAEVLLRGVTEDSAKRTWDRQRCLPKVDWRVFALRACEEYLSVDRRALSTPGQSFKRWNERERHELALSLHTGRVRQLRPDLDVEAKPLPDNEAHAGIIGLPNRFVGNGCEKAQAHARAHALGQELYAMAQLAGYGDAEAEESWERRRQEAEGHDA